MWTCRFTPLNNFFLQSFHNLTPKLALTHRVYMKLCITTAIAVSHHPNAFIMFTVIIILEMRIVVFTLIEATNI